MAILVGCALLNLGVAAGSTAVDPDPLELSGAARGWVREKVGSTGSALARLQRLSRAVATLRLTQITDHSPTAGEVLAGRRTDCVGYAHLFVALARELEVDAYFVLFEDPRKDVDRRGVRVAVNHMTAGFGEPGRVTVFDMGGMRTPEAGTYRRVTDATARAVFLSNRGTESLVGGKAAPAVRLLGRATELDPQLTTAWTNLGVALRHAGDVRGAEQAYRRAIHTDPESVAAWRNLAILLGGNPFRTP